MKASTTCATLVHCCGTNANLCRVSAAVCCKNLGEDESLSRVFLEAKLSPSFSAFQKTLKSRRKLKTTKQGLPEMKKRRLFLKMKHSCSSSEGVTYSSGMAHTMQRAAAATLIDNAWLPQATVLRPSCKTVLVDMETSGLSASASIVQLAAKCGDAEFSVHILPHKQMEPQAAAVTG